MGFFRDSDFLDSCRESEGFDSLRESDGLDILRESEIFDNLDEPNGLDVFKESEIFDAFRESDSLDVLSGSVAEESSLVLLRVFCWSWELFRGLLLRLDNDDVEGLSVCNAL